MQDTLVSRPSIFAKLPLYGQGWLINRTQNSYSPNIEDIVESASKRALQYESQMQRLSVSLFIGFRSDFNVPLKLPFVTRSSSQKT